MREDYLVLNKLNKVFSSSGGEVQAVEDVSLRVKEGELVTLLGPSGCGKTTTLRMIAGFENPTSGEIFIDGEKMNAIPPNQRPTTMVFQNYALFPHMQVGENISYGLRIRNLRKEDIRSRTEEVMRLVGLTGMGSRAPAQLSGGQQQRVSLARSLIMEPKVLLLDEPLSNLDAKLRVATRLEIRRLQQRIKITSVYVTHDQEEAMTLSDRVVIMRSGKIQQVGTPREIYAHPINRFVADFIGRANFLDAQFIRQVSESEAEILLFDRRIKVPRPQTAYRENEKVILVVRPESMYLRPAEAGALCGTVYEMVYLGNQITYRIEIGDVRLSVEMANPQEHRLFEVGEEVALEMHTGSLHILPPEEDKE
ncbi:MAG: ABC transporter ATP-binding protein [Spirochaetota bacterium]|nr:ABC transporter ATP-binding protein [Spirochaetota bacterium]